MTRAGFLLLPVALWGQGDGLQYSLTQYVKDDGTVNYAGLKKDLSALDGYVERLKTLNVESLGSREAKLAQWINTYNALILWSFAKEYPEEKDRLRNALKRANYFYRRKFPVGGQQRSLADIEDNSLRKGFKEPRIHFAIVCASASCPALSRTVYTEKNVLEKLEEDARRFITAERNVKVDEAAKTVTVSEIFKWFQADFGGSEGAVLGFLGRYIKSARLEEPGWKIKYRDYDWTINESR